MDDVLNQIKKVRNGNTVLVDYSYLGQAQSVITNYSRQPGMELT